MRTILSFHSALPSASLCELLQSAANAGHHGVELPSETPDGIAIPETRKNGHNGITLVRWMTSIGGYNGLDAVDRAQRRQAVDRMRAMLCAARRIKATLLSVGSTVSSQTAPPQASHGEYADRLHALLRSLRTAAEEAEIQGLRVAIEPVCDGLLLSPVEMRDLIETVNSPFVGASIDVARAAGVSRPADWIHTLRHRVFMVRRPGPVETAAGNLDAIWQSCADGLVDIAFDGVIAVSADDDLASNFIDQQRRSADVRDDDLAGKR